MPGHEDSRISSSPIKRNRKGRVAYDEDHVHFLDFARQRLSPLEIMRATGLTPIQFARHYLDALKKRECEQLPEGEVFKPSVFPVEIRQYLEASDDSLFKVELCENGLLIRRI